MGEKIVGENFEHISYHNLSGLLAKSSGLIDGIAEGFSEGEEFSLDSLFSDIQVIKMESTRRVIIGVMKSGKKIYCKNYRERSAIDFVRRMLGGNRAEQAHRRCEIFAGTGARTPKSLGYVVRKTSPVDLDSYHFCEFVEGSVTLAQWLDEGRESSSILEQLSTQLALIHKKSYIHGDTKLSNFLCSDCSLFFVDLDGFKRAGKKYSAARDVARLIVALTEADLDEDSLNQFVGHYCVAVGIDKRELVKNMEPLIAYFQKKHDKKYARKRKVINLG